MKQYKIPTILKHASIVFVSTSALMLSAQADTTLISEDFSGYTTTGSASTTELNSNDWFFTNSGTGGTGLRIQPDDGNNALWNYGSSGGYTTGLKQFSTTTLTELGDSITLSLDYHNAGGGVSNLYIRLLDTENTVTANGFGTDPIPDAAGYGLLQSTSATNALRFVEMTDNAAYGVGPYDYLPRTGANHDNLGVGSPYSIVMSATKVATGIELILKVDGTTVMTASDTTPRTTFNTLSLYYQANTNNVFVDNILLTTNIPEPSSAGLITAGGALLAVAMCRRRIK